MKVLFVILFLQCSERFLVRLIPRLCFAATNVVLGKHGIGIIGLCFAHLLGVCDSFLFFCCCCHFSMHETQWRPPALPSAPIPSLILSHLWTLQVGDSILFCSLTCRQVIKFCSSCGAIVFPTFPATHRLCVSSDSDVFKFLIRINNSFICMIRPNHHHRQSFFWIQTLN